MFSAASQEVREFVAAYQGNRNVSGRWQYQIIAEDRRKYVAIDETDADDPGPPYIHRSGVFLIDQTDGCVYRIRGYGKRGPFVGSITTLTARYRAGTASFFARRTSTGGIT